MKHKHDKEWLLRAYVKSTNLYGKMIETRDEVYTTTEKMNSKPLVIYGKEGSRVEIRIFP
ncbi:hypothetical protein [Candidatus Bealeia paramacronuclearis]|uniref:hypothetical protein n=1 Tax=Candidatus Bealeia paramacronuclearis TaxID=1921001 RepID=UPI002F26C37B